MKYYLVALFVIFLLSGCVKKHSVKEEEPMGATIFEEISPDEVDTSSFVFEETDTEEPSTSFLEELEEETPPVISEPVTSQGYRVQIGAYQAESQANSAADRARGLLGRSVYIQYIAPYYKVRVGNFTDKFQAAQYKNQLRSTTPYRDAFVTGSEIIVE